jgi:parvulin-like peptidyl-prolyl isomerase
MKKIILILALIFPLQALSQISASQNYIVAKINNKAITSSELLDRYRYVVLIAKLSEKTQSNSDLLKAQILDKMIDEELIRQEAKALNIEASADEIKEAVEIISNQQKKNSNQMKFFLNGKGISFENFVKQVESELLWSKIISQNLSAKIKVSDVEIRELFEQEKFNVSVRKFLLSELVISKDKALGNMAQSFANGLVSELKNGANFSNMVKQFSTGFSSENGGEIGWVSQNEIDKKIYEEVSKLKKGGYSNPILLSDGYHIFKLVDAKVENKIHDQDLKAARNIIFSRKLQTAAKGYLIDIRKKSYVEIDRIK